jgi:hypothetical protein
MNDKGDGDDSLEQLTSQYLENMKTFDVNHVLLRERFHALQSLVLETIERWEKSRPHTIRLETNFRRVLQHSNLILDEFVEIDRRRVETFQKLRDAGRIAKENGDLSHAVEVTRRIRDASVFDLEEGLPSRIAALDMLEASASDLVKMLKRPKSS